MTSFIFLPIARGFSLTYHFRAIHLWQQCKRKRKHAQCNSKMQVSTCCSALSLWGFGDCSIFFFCYIHLRKKKLKLNITMFSLLDKSIQHELIHIYLKDWFNGYFVVHLAFLDTFNRKGSLMESHILLNHLFWQYLIYSVHPKGTKVIWGRFKI